MAFRNINVIIGANTVGLQAGLKSASAALNAFITQLNSAAGAASGAGTRIASGANAGAAGINNLNRGLGAGLNTMGRFNAAGTVGTRMLAAMGQQASIAGKAVAGLGVFVRETATIFTGFLAVNATIRAVTAAIRFLTDAFMEFDTQLVNSMAIMGDMTDRMEANLVKGTQRIAETTTFTAAEAAEGLYFIASAGFDATSALEALPVAATFAQAGLLDMASSTEYLLDVTRAYDLVQQDAFGGIDVEPTVKNMQRVSDVITKAAIDSNATIDQLAAALTNKAAGASRLLGIEIEETAAALETFASVGIKGQVAGTQFNMVVRDLQKVAVNSGAEMRALGIDVFDASGEFNNLSTILMQFQSAMAGMSDEQKRATLTMLGFQDRSLGAIMAVSDMGAEMATFENRLKSAGGATQEVAEKQLQALSAQLQLLKNRIGNFAIDTGRAFMDWVAGIADATQGTREAIYGFFEGIVKTARPVVGALASVTSAVIGMGAAVANSAIGSAFSWMSNLPVMAAAVSFGIQKLAVMLGARLPAALATSAGQVALLGRAFNATLAPINVAATGISRLGQRLASLHPALASAGQSMMSFANRITFVGYQSNAAGGTLSYLTARLYTLNAATIATGNAFMRFGAFVARNLAMINTGILLFVTFWQQSLSEAKSEADQFVSSLTQDIDTSTWDGVTEAYERLRKAQNKAVDDMNKEFGSGGFWDNVGTRLGNLGESLVDAFGGNNGVDEIAAMENKLSEATLKLHTTIQNVAGVGQVLRAQDPAGEIRKMQEALIEATGGLDGARRMWDTGFDQMVSVTQASNALIYKSMQDLGYDLENVDLLKELAPEDWKAISDQIDAVRHAARFAANDLTNWTDVSDTELQGLLSRSAEVEEGLVDMFAAMASAADAYKASLIEVADVQDIWSDLVTETTDAYNEAVQEAQQAAEEAASARADALSSSADARVDELEAAKQAELDALSISSREAKEAAKEAGEALDASDDIADATDANVDAITDGSTAEKRAIEKKYDDQIKAVRAGSKAASDAAGDVAGAETEDKVIPAAQRFLDTLNEQIEGYKDYQNRLSELVRAGASVELVDMFRNMDPEEGKVLMAQILDPTKTFVQDFNNALENLGKVESAPNWDVLKAQMDAKVDNMRDFAVNAEAISFETGVSIEDILAVATDMEKAGIPVGEAFAGFMDQITMGNTAQVAELFNQWKVMGNRTIPDAVRGMDETLNLMSAIIHGDVEKMEDMMGEVSPEQFYEQLYNMGFDETYVRMIATRFGEMLGDMDADLKQQAADMVAFIQGQVGQVAWNQTTGRFERVDPGFGMPLGGGVKVFAEGGINRFASGSESHVAQIAKGNDVRIWAEPETGGEAYIPLSAQKRPRSLAILAEVAKEFGFGLYKNFADGGLWNAPTMSAGSGMQQPQVVVVPVQTTNTYQFGDIQGVRMEDAMAYANRQKRQRNLTT